MMYAARRSTLMNRMKNGVAVLFSASEQVRSRDTNYPFRQDSYFDYLTGFPEPDSVMVLTPDHPAHEFVLFVRPKDPLRETWDGRRFGVAGAQREFGADETHPIEMLPELLPGYLENKEALYFAVGHNPGHDRLVMHALETVRGKVRLGIKAPEAIVDPAGILDEMRLIKSEQELGRLRKACSISAAAHVEAMRTARPGMMEYEIESLLNHAFRKSGSAGPGYNSIVGGGVNATILHYTENQDCLRSGDVLLIDAGCEVKGYSADITRTFPVDSSFTSPQRDIYELVLNAQMRGIEASVSGSTTDAVHQATLRVLVEGMIDLKILHGPVEEAIETESYKSYYMHRTGHWLGMDVHDVGAYRLNGEWRPLQPGMVMTVEPGLYFAADSSAPEAFKGIGIRIEDDVLITTGAAEVLTHEVPKSVSEIEALRGESEVPV